MDKNASMPRLKINGSYKYEGEQEVRVLSGVVRVTLGGVQFPPVAFATGEIVSSIMQRGKEDSFEAFIWTDPETLRRIEASKLDTTVDLQVQMRFAELGANQRAGEGHGRMAQPFTIKTRDWIAILEGFGIGSRWRATVVVPTGPLAGPFQNMEPDLKQAFAHLATGNYPEVLVSSRKVLERLWDAVGEVIAGGSVWPTGGRFRNEVSAKLDAPNVAKAGKDPYSTKLYKYGESLYKLHHMGAHDGYVVTKAISEACYTGSLLVLQALSDALSVS